MQIYFVKNQLFDSAKVLRKNNSVTDSYRILPILTDFYRILPILTASYRFLPILTDSGVLLRSMGEEGMARKRLRRSVAWEAGGKLRIES